MIRIAVCDDEQRIREKLRSYIDKYAKNKFIKIHVDTYENGKALVLAFEKQYDIIFLDVEMPELNGLETAERIRKQDNLVSIFFLTCHEKYAYQSYSVEANGYQTKPVSYDNFKMLMDKSLIRIQEKQGKILLEGKGTVRMVLKSSIVYISYFNHKLTYHLIDGETIDECGSIKKFLSNDTENLFFQIHKSYIINMIWIEKCKNQEVYLKGMKECLSVSRHRWTEFYDQYLRYCRDKLK